jgi:hypothetical protein
MLITILTIGEMSPWEVIEQALARHRPPKNQEWLAEQLSRTGKPVTPQAISNWKKRQVVPTARFAEIADLFRLTTDQVAGRAPLPWETVQGWPFPGIDEARFARLDDMQKGEIQAKVREMIEGFEARRAGGGGGGSGKSAGSGDHHTKRSAQV